MVKIIDVCFHFGGRWSNNPDFCYVDDETEFIPNFDADFLALTHIRAKYTEDLGFPNVQKIFFCLNEKPLSTHMFLAQSDDDILKIVNKKKDRIRLDIYADHDIDNPLIIEDIPRLNWHDSDGDDVSVDGECQVHVGENGDGEGDRGPSAVDVEEATKGEAVIISETEGDNGTEIESVPDVESEPEDSMPEVESVPDVEADGDEFEAGNEYDAGNESEAGNEYDAGNESESNAEIESDESETDAEVEDESESDSDESNAEVAEQGSESESDESANDEGHRSDGNGSTYYSSDDLGSYEIAGSGSEEDDAKRRKSGKRKYSHKTVSDLALGMTFSDAKEVRKAISNYSVTHGKPVKFIKNEPDRVRVKCVEQNCPFLLLASRPNKDERMEIKTLILDHKCGRKFQNRSASCRFVAEHFARILKMNPSMKAKDIKKQLKEEYRVNVSQGICKRAKRKVLTDINSNYITEFARLDAYAGELRRTNPGSKVEVELCPIRLRDGKRVFRRLFICFEACKRGWLNGCRPIIGMDGCFLKGVTKGILLCAVGKDGNNHMFPIAWAIVDVEDKDNWRWFLHCLVEALDLKNGVGLTIISDMQKGLVTAAKEAVPEAEHRWCARHVYANWSKDWRGGELKQKFWACAWSTYEEEFIDNLNKMAADHGDRAAGDLMKYTPTAWSKAYISARCKCDMVDNNVAETFNSWVNEFRDRPPITLLEEIRKKVMTRIAHYKNFTSTWQADFSPDCLGSYECNFLLSAECEILFNGDDGYEVSHGDDQHSVSFSRRSCTCRLWDISGIPCAHAIAAIYHAGGNPLEYICNCFNKTMFQNAYQFSLQPVRGVKFWNCASYQPIEPPPFKQQPGRPKKNRVRDKHETKKTTASHKLQRQGGNVKCGICKGLGHNKKTCNRRNHQGGPSSIETEGGHSNMATSHGGPPPAVHTTSHGVPPPAVHTTSHGVPPPAVHTTSHGGPPLAVHTTGHGGPPPTAQASVGGPLTQESQCFSRYYTGNARQKLKVRKAQARNFAKTLDKQKEQQNSGVGVTYDPPSGRTSFLGSVTAAQVVDPGNAPAAQQHTDAWSFRYSLRQRSPLLAPSQRATTEERRKINFRPDGQAPVNLPFTPSSGMTYGGNPAITLTELQRQARKRKTPIDSGQSSQQLPQSQPILTRRRNVEEATEKTA
ncbi:uncharacterized protein LOC126678406 isoform X2 [Mercurialis annua]|nr:uncharacterized protein LOC126678406 isoform X2 [Mercurialis annua]